MGLQQSPIDDPESETEAEPDERTALLPGKPPNEVEAQIVPVDGERQSALDLVRDPNFWILFVVSLITLGCVSPISKSLSMHTNSNVISAKWSYQT